MTDPAAPATLTRTFGALSDPTRRAVVRRLVHGPLTVGTLAAEHAMSLPAFTKHIGVLVDAGLVARRKVGRTVECTLRPAALAEAHAWLDDMTAFWTGSLDRLEALLDDTQEDR
ncbi:helix-turn-helix transcriptional regulator [Actinotalea ferrariae]|uniref:ArsR/SmtB family transcription factor n=1 Tax=Actinotalea ferrariae TaxID=1386098 RepID=UPI001C8BFE87|nr:metalloregulator ArsR/SmtB family transcription factor [Actinotalea ferrariae]MBX9246142.1 helix-turn-helix transcriptional regulator [Actinotalea ferrariae]